MGPLKPRKELSMAITREEVQHVAMLFRMSLSEIEGWCRSDAVSLERAVDQGRIAEPERRQ
jgi:hypothetical protein